MKRFAKVVSTGKKELNQENQDTSEIGTCHESGPIHRHTEYQTHASIIVYTFLP